MKRKHGGKQPADKKAEAAQARIGSELGELGRKVEKALRSAATSGHVSGLRGDITKGVRNVGKRLGDALGALRDSEESRELRTQLKKVIQTGRKEGVEASKKVASNLAAGLDTLSKELSKLASRLEKK